MSTDLRAALRAAAATEPFDTADVQAVVDAGERRIRRRAAVVLGTTALAVATVAASLAVLSDRSAPVPSPAHVITLDLDRAPHRHLDSLGSVRTMWHDVRQADLDQDKFIGLTTDGLVLRSRYNYPEGSSELGLFDPVTGRTDWLPAPVMGAAATPVDLGADRLVLFNRIGMRRAAIEVYDRNTRTWESTDLLLEPGLEAHVPVRLELTPDDRLYLGSTFENEPTLQWWSYSLAQGGRGRAEPALVDSGIDWSDGLQLTASADGRVTVAGAGTDQIVADGRPADCERPDGSDVPRYPVAAALAGDRPVVTYGCHDQDQVLTIVYALNGRATLQIPGARLVAADRGHVLLGGVELSLLDLSQDTLVRIAPGGQENDYALANGLVLWNNAGPIEDRNTYDVVWKVARLPHQD